MPNIKYPNTIIYIYIYINLDFFLQIFYPISKSIDFSINHTSRDAYNNSRNMKTQDHHGPGSA